MRWPNSSSTFSMHSPLRNFAWTTEACWFFQAKKPSEKIVGILDERSGDTVRNSTQRQRHGQCHPNATPGVLPSPLSKYSSTIRRKFNAGGGNRTHTGITAREDFKSSASAASVALG